MAGAAGRRLKRLPVTLILVGCLVWASGLVNVPQAVLAAPSRQPSQGEPSDADFNGDGHADLALSGSDDSGASSRSPIRILYGADDGLSSQPQIFLLEDLVSPGQNDRGLWGGFGLGPLTSGDFDGDGFSDLAIGIPGLDVGDVPEAGGVLIIPGSDRGLDVGRRTLFTQASPGIADAPRKKTGSGCRWLQRIWAMAQRTTSSSEFRPRTSQAASTTAGRCTSSTDRHGAWARPGVRSGGRAVQGSKVGRATRTIGALSWSPAVSPGRPSPILPSGIPETTTTRPRNTERAPFKSSMGPGTDSLRRRANAGVRKARPCEAAVFAQRNPAACPVLDVTEPGAVQPPVRR